jgi:ATP synthase protein I
VKPFTKSRARDRKWPSTSANALSPALTRSSRAGYTPGAQMAGKPDQNAAWADLSAGWAVSSYMLAAVGLWGGLGFLVDHLLGTPKVFTAIGMVLGAALGTYLIYLRYGKEHVDEKT